MPLLAAAGLFPPVHDATLPPFNPGRSPDRGYCAADQDVAQMETTLLPTGWRAILKQWFFSFLSALVWILIVLHPLALIALSFHWGLL